MLNVWKMIQEKKLNRITFAKKHKHILVPSQRYQDSRHLLQNPTVPNYVIGFSNCAQRFTGSNYLDVDSPFTFFKLVKLIYFFSLLPFFIKNAFNVLHWWQKVQPFE